MEIEVFKIIGAIGMIFIIFGLLIKNKFRNKRDLFYLTGGILLLIYSVSINDFIFITLQIIFIFVAGYDLIKINQTKK